MNRILYSGTRNASSWAFRAWLALREAGVDFEERIVDIRKPQRFENLARIQAFSPPGAVPVLVDDGTVIFDSLAIMEHANELCAGRLLPPDIKRRARARALFAWQHSGLSNLCPRLSFESAFYPDRRAMTEAERADAKRIFDAWENELAQSAGPFLVGNLSLPDLAFLPTIVRLTSHMDHCGRWPLAAAWIERMLSRPSVQEWMQEAHALPPVILDDDYRT
jgi:glutathione S-transferase